MTGASAASAASAEITGIRATRAIIDLDAIGVNVRALRGVLPARTKLMAVVKADGYGHGAPWVAKAAVDAGASVLGVATVSEGHILREHGLEVPIVLLGSIEPAEALAACEARLEMTVSEESLLDAVQRIAGSMRDSQVAVHVKVDTGLRRYGAAPEQALALATRIAADSRLRFAGVSTHFASADEPGEPFTVEQLRRFEDALGTMRGAGLELPPVHAANSAGILLGHGVEFDMVRAGIALYGVRPSAEVSLLPSMRPAMRIESRIARTVSLCEGDTIGYNRTFRAHEPMVGVLVPIGYADGYRRALSGKGWVGIAGRSCRVLGRVSMDQIVVEAPSGVSAAVGDTVHVIGDDPVCGAPSFDEIAALSGTNSYEILVGIAPRVPRVFVRNGEVVGMRTVESAGTTRAAPNSRAGVNPERKARRLPV
jgi:alanine racemase